MMMQDKHELFLKENFVKLKIEGIILGFFKRKKKYQGCRLLSPDRWSEY